MSNIQKRIPNFKFKIAKSSKILESKLLQGGKAIFLYCSLDLGRPIVLQRLGSMSRPKPSVVALGYCLWQWLNVDKLRYNAQPLFWVIVTFLFQDFLPQFTFLSQNREFSTLNLNINGLKRYPNITTYISESLNQKLENSSNNPEKS